MASITYESKSYSQGYAEYFRIAEKALKQLKDVRLNQKKNHDHIINNASENILKPDLSIFTDIQLKLICFDYAFAAWENFLEHVGFMLFDDWDGANKQKHYRKKYEKLEQLELCLSEQRYSNIDYQEIKKEWLDVLHIVDLDYIKKAAKKRNRIKHLHSDKHEGKKISTVVSSGIMDQLNQDMYFDIADKECVEFVSKIEDLINKTHSFLGRNESIFGIYAYYGKDDRVILRKDFWRNFLITPLMLPFYSQSGRYTES